MIGIRFITGLVFGIEHESYEDGAWVIEVYLGFFSILFGSAVDYE